MPHLDASYPTNSYHYMPELLTLTELRVIERAATTWPGRRVIERLVLGRASAPIIHG